MSSSIVNWIQIGNDLSQKYKVWRHGNNTVSSTIEHGVETPKQIETTNWNVMFYDIETYQNDISHIILPQHEDFLTNCEVRLICAYNYYKNSITKYVYTLETLRDNIIEVRGTKYFYSSNPSALFLEHLRLISGARPTMLVGYNSSSGSLDDTYPGYDLPAIFSSAGYNPYINYTHSLLDNRRCKNILVFDNVFTLDLLPFSYQYCVTNSYKNDYITNLRANSGLDGLARVFGHGGKNSISFQTLNDGLCGDGINTVIDYCLQDVNVCYEVFKTMNVIEYFNGFINSFKISPLTVLRGQQAKTVYTLDSIKQKNTEWELSGLDLPSDAEYKGGKTTCEVSGVYELIAITDFNSLYPSVCIEYNICYSTYIGLEDTVSPTADVYRVPNVYKGLAACFHKRYQGHIPTFMRHCLDTRKKLKELYAKTKNPSIKFEEQAAKVLANGGYGSTGSETFPYYRKCVAFSITAAGRHTLGIMNSIYNDLHIKVILGDTDSSFGVAEPQCTLKIESEVVLAINTDLDKMGFKYLRVSGELGDTPSKVLSLGKKKQYIATKNGVLKCAGYASSTKSTKYNELVFELLRLILAAFDDDECINAFIEFRSQLYTLYNNHELYYNTKVRRTDKYDVQPLTSYVKWIPSKSGVKITSLVTDDIEYVIEHFYKHIVCTYLGYEDSRSSLYRHYYTGMSVHKMWSQITYNTKNTHMHEDSRALININDYMSSNICYVYNNIYNSLPYSIIRAKKDVTQYYQQLESKDIERCMSLALRCRKYNSTYLVGIDIDSKHSDRVNVWPSDTLGCKTRKGYHFFYYTDSISGIKNVYGLDTSRVGSVEVKKNNLSLELIGFHRSLEFKYLVNNTPIVFIQARELKQRLATFEYLSTNTYNNEYLNSNVQHTDGVRYITGTVTSNTSECNEESYNSEVLSSTELIESYWTNTPTIIPSLRGIDDIEESEDEDEDDVISTSLIEQSIVNRPTLSSNDILTELKLYCDTITSEQWKDYSGFIVGLFLPLQSLLTLEERQCLITYCEFLPNFRFCSKRNKLRSFIQQTTKEKAMCLGTLRKNKHSLPKLIERTYTIMSNRSSTISDTEIRETLTIDDFYTEHKVLAIKAPCAHGKTKVMCEYIRALDEEMVIVLLTNRNIQIEAYTTELQLPEECINIICGGNSYEENKRVYIATFESSWKLNALLKTSKLIYVFVDEAESYLSQIRSSPNYTTYVSNHETVLKLLAKSYAICLLDAFLSDNTIKFLSVGNDVTKREFTHSHMKVKTEIIDGGKSKLMLEQSLPSEGDTKMLQLDLEIKKELESGGSIGICSDEKRMTEKYYNSLSTQYPCKIINSDNPLVLRDFNPDDYRVIIWSPTVQHTTSIIPKTNFTRTFCIVQHRYLEDFKITNMVHRIRTISKITLFIRNLGQMYTPKSLDTLENDYYKMLSKYKPFLVNYHKSGNVLRDIRVMQSVSKLHAINALQRFIPHTFERYRDLMKYTSISVERLELSHETNLTRSCDMWPYPHKPKKLDIPLQDQHTSLNINLQILRADSLLKEIHEWLSMNTEYDIRQIEPIKLSEDETTNLLTTLSIDDIKKLIDRVNRTRYTNCEIHSPNSIVFVRIIDRVHTSEDRVITAHNTHIEPIICGREMHVPSYAICPGEGWVKKKVGINCEHRYQHCWIKKIPIPGCNGVVHILCSESPEAPDDDGWIKKKVRRRCEHRNLFCWERVISE